MSPELSRAQSVAVIGTGVIGRSWIRVFARAGLETRIWDPNPEQVEAAWTWLKADLKRARKEHGLRKRVVRAEREQVVRCQTLEEALQNVFWVQESGPENLDAKRTTYAELDRLAPPKAVLASSTSALDMSAIAEGLPGANRCIVAHPVNPPPVVPVVEVLGGAHTDPLVVRRAVRFLERVGQTPVLLRKYVPGFLLNRMQAALMREAVSLVKEGVTTPEGVDAVIREGLGLRWALLGPFGVANTNADGGVREYFTRYGPSFERLIPDLTSEWKLTPELMDSIGKSVDATNRRVPRELQRTWRDDMVVRIRELKTMHPVVEPEEGE
jgi:3-hydroxyacyl-CoA dehydrogenase